MKRTPPHFLFNFLVKFPRMKFLLADLVIEALSILDSISSVCCTSAFTLLVPFGGSYFGLVPFKSYIHCISSVCTTNRPTTIFPYSFGVNITLTGVGFPPSKYPFMGVKVNSIADSGVSATENGTDLLVGSGFTMLIVLVSVWLTADSSTMVPSMSGSVASRMISNLHRPPEAFVMTKSTEVWRTRRGSKVRVKVRGSSGDVIACWLAVMCNARLRAARSAGFCMTSSWVKGSSLPRGPRPERVTSSWSWSLVRALVLYLKVFA
mmetsp:Transcript_35502/g.42761  ORF Transcript_35502/g.42761 Transcript_35502/m.42761 type:complete len:264 (-) Transcript_35502:1489-2280(-)